MSRISLYIPCYNGGPHLAKVLDAALAQSRPADEILVIDDGSTDQSREIAASYPVTLVTHDKNLGLGATRNTALAKASGELIAALDSDVVAEKNWLKNLSAQLEAGNYGGAGGKMVEGFQTTLADRWRAKVMCQHHGEISKDNIFVFGCNTIYKRGLLQDLGGYDPKCRSSYEDFEMWTRVQASGAATRYAADALCYHQRRDTIDSVLDGCYSWRRPGFERTGSYESPKTIATKWVVSTSTDTLMIKSLVEQVMIDIAQLSLLGTMRYIYKDAIIVGENHPEMRETLLPAVAGILAILVLDITSNYPVLRKILFADLDRYITRLSGQGYSEAASVLRRFRRPLSGVADQILREMGVVETVETAPLFVVMPWLASEIKTIDPALARLEASWWDPLIAERDGA